MSEARRRRRLDAPQPNVVDRVVGYFDPVAGARRLHARTVMAVAGGYHGGQSSRRSLSDWSTSNADADGDLNTNLPKLRERSRDLARNSPIAAGAFGTKVDHIVGTGLAPRPRIDYEFLGIDKDKAKTLASAIKREWALWAESKDCDASRSQNFYDLQALALRGVLESGDILALLPFIERPGSPYGLKVQLVEADRLSNPKRAMDTATLVQGVEKDGNGAAIRYHISRTHPGDLKNAGKMEWDAVEAFSKSGRPNVLHLYRKLRPGQTRGVPDLAPVIESIKQLDRYREAEIMAAVISGMFTVFVKTQNGTGLGPMAPTTETGGSTSDEDFKLANGAILDLLPGEEVQFANPGRPNANYDPFVVAILREVAVGLDLPFEVLMKHFTASYSASKAALLIAWKFFLGRRAWLGGNFCDPVYEALLTEAVARGRLAMPGFLNGDPAIRKAYLGVEWVGDAPGHLDEEKEVNAARGRIELGVSTRDREAMLITGEDFEAVTRQLGDEKVARDEAGLVDVPRPGSAVPQAPEGGDKDAQAALGRVFERALNPPAPVVHVHPTPVTVLPTPVNVAAPIVNVPAPNVVVNPPAVTVRAPTVNVPAPVVNIEQAASLGVVRTVVATNADGVPTEVVERPATQADIDKVPR